MPVDGLELSTNQKLASQTPVDGSEDRLVTLGIELGRAHLLSDQKLEGFPLLEHFEQQEELLRTIHQRISREADSQLAQTHAAEWLLDNFYLVEETFQQIREDFPKNYYRKLPILEGTEFAYHPRVFGIAWNLIQHVGLNPNYDQITRFMSAYQREAVLKIGEIWAMPTMLRIVILEYLAQAMARMAGMSFPPLGPKVVLTGGETEQRDLVGDCIQGLRSLKITNWKQYFEAVSQVEKILCQDPVNVYAQMDFDSRDRYRKAVEELSQESGLAEDKIASVAIQMAKEIHARQPGAEDPAVQVQMHAGYYLVERGRPDLEERIAHYPGRVIHIKRWMERHAFSFYVSSILGLAIFLLYFPLAYLVTLDGSLAQLIGAGILSFLPATAVAVNLVNFAITHILPPRPALARLDFSEGVPKSCRTLVVIPALLTSGAGIEALLRQVELYFLGNDDDEIFFALLTDYADALHQHMPQDEDLLLRAVSGIEELNERYGHSEISKFFLFHRDRRWNPSENVWMGWERKRGKLVELNDLLRGRNTGTFSRIVGNIPGLEAVKYVLTVDEDTVLPNNAARQLIGKMAHPFNRPQFDPESRQVIAGYTLLQPRVEVRPESTQQTWFTHIYAREGGIDLYSQVVSNVYQDLFAEGSYMGKGIYDVDGFMRSVEGQIPENAVLSHDLIEGLLGRAGLVTDVVLYEGFPPYYLAYAQRIHRWVRGDWQLLPWLLPFLKGLPPGAKKKALTPLGYWKVVDNLRRSLIHPGILALLVASWLWFPGSLLFWLFIAILPLAVPVFTGIIPNIWLELRSNTVRSLWQSIRFDLLRWLTSIIFLPYQTLLVVDAIATTLVRLILTRKRLLQWTTASHSIRVLRKEYKVQATWNRMRIVILFDLILALLVGFLFPEKFILVGPVLVLWLVSPSIAHLISQPIDHNPAALSAEEHKDLHTLARRTWLFFEQFVGPEDHWLFPDHFQEEPRGTVAHRTSPTNIGLGLLSIVAAYDLGYINLSELSIRLRNTLNELKPIEKYSGHLLNWYETHNLKPLLPRYVSTVDSGNFAGCLLVLQQGCSEIIRKPVLRPQGRRGLLDTLELLKDRLVSTHLESRDKPMMKLIEEIQQEVLDIGDHPTKWLETLKTILDDQWVELNQQIRKWIDTHGLDLEPDVLRELRIWTERTHQHLMSMLQTFDTLLPWLGAFDQVPPILNSDEIGPLLKESWKSLIGVFPASVTLEEIEGVCEGGLEKLGEFQTSLQESQLGVPSVMVMEWCDHLKEGLVFARQQARDLLTGFQEIAEQAEANFEEMDFSFLYNEQRNLFRIGYNVDTGLLDENHYDLLASEARLASLIAIAKGDVPQKHWLYMGRPLTRTNQGHALISWSGSMFEYLMPRLLMKQYPNTLLNLACTTVVKKQIDYCHAKGIPWGISESGYFHFDANMNYQYRAFGVPGLGLKRGLDVDLVITPYATILSLPFKPSEVMENFSRLVELGMLGLYGFYEALDFTEARLPLAKEYAPIRSFMAHHQGMILLSLDNFLENDPMVRRFHADPRIEACELLLQEQIPANPRFEVVEEQEMARLQRSSSNLSLESWTPRTNAGFPSVHFLSNGRLGSLITNNGGGFMQYMPAKTRGGDPILLTRWQADSTLDPWGTWIYIEDIENGHFWSAGIQPTGFSPEMYKVNYSPHQVEFNRREGDISTQTLICISAEENAEIRKISLVNHHEKSRHLRITSYGEVVLSEQRADIQHQAFNKIFVESEYIPELSAILFKRRPRSADEESTYLVHMLVTRSTAEKPPRFECDRAHFIGRGNSARNPDALEKSKGLLSNTYGITLDPVMALSQEIELEPRKRFEMALVTLAAPSRQKAILLAKYYRLWPRVERAFRNAAWANGRELAKLDLTIEDLEVVQQLLSVLVYPSQALREKPEILAANVEGQSGLWRFSISGDFPIALVRVQQPDHTVLVKELLKAHRYWRQRGIKIDLVILYQGEASYNPIVLGQLYQLVTQMGSDRWVNQRGGIFLLNAGQMKEKDVILLETAARAVLDGGGPSFAEQVKSISAVPPRLPEFVPMGNALVVDPSVDFVERPGDLQFDNGYGGFSPSGEEYVVYLKPGQWTPAPWINVIANPDFGCVASESGMGCTWAGNSGENRLTPWRNDPVSDLPAEAIYLRNEETGQVWSPTPLPARAASPYKISHGAGYTFYEHKSSGLEQHLRVFVDPQDALKFVSLRLKNTLDQPRQFTVTYYAEWVLGPDRGSMAPFIVPEFDPEWNALLARNEYNQEFRGRTAFLAASREIHGFTTDRAEFLGLNGSYAHPEALSRVGLSGALRAGGDACAALQVLLWLGPGETKEVTFLLGQGKDRQEASRWIGEYRKIEAIENSWQRLQEKWASILDRIKVETPDCAMNLLLNRWLLYQVISCRLWGRTALYQSSGAYGFRDQLQDVMALVHAAPELARDHILRAARRQFEAGDVLHWWHPPSGRGVRTRCSDNMLWLPYVTAHYVSATGDVSILQENVPFLSAKPLEDEEHERYDFFEMGEETGTLLEHCRRAIQFGSTAGSHGLPLIGSHDWNDGLNRVGIKGKGESVWLGWFLYTTLQAFRELCEKAGEPDQVGSYRNQAEKLRQSIEECAWDGAWYRRAYFDDGTPLGSAVNDECRIDSLPQSWAVLSKAADPERARRAMQSVQDMLVNWGDALVMLFTPPFDKSLMDPGYIKGYPPGIRENGGQYTHAAIWATWAFASLGKGKLAGNLYKLLNPIYHSDTFNKANRYRVEPYVIAADVYSVGPHTGKGGWTWYSGSAGWMYQVGLEVLLGFKRAGDRLHIDPCIPEDWPEFSIKYRYGEALYHLHVVNPSRASQGISQIRLDGALLTENPIHLVDDHQAHLVEIILG